jgi:nucleotidyltransferase/DNA polymerase involved in DNA repair
MVVCIHLPRFELTVAAGGATALAGQPLAVAPGPGERCVGEVSGAAEAHGVKQGMQLGEALARCPSLGLLPADPVGVAEAWEASLGALEEIGAAVETPAAGVAFFAADGLLRLHRGLPGVIEAAREAMRVGGQVGRPPRIGVGPSRFCAMAAALMARPRRGAVIVQQREAGRWLSAQPVELLRFRDQTAELVLPLFRLGVRTLGALRRLGRDALSDRFGRPGVLAYDLAGGWDTPLVPRQVAEHLEEAMELREADSGPALERVLSVLIERLLASPQRAGRTLRAVTLSAKLVEGGTWRQTIAFRHATAKAERMCLALCPHLAGLPAPAQALQLRVESFGPPGGEQQDLLGAADQQRRLRLAEAVGQARAAAGPDAALRVVLVEPGSRAPERRAVLSPFQG